jgi:polyferredoxin
VCCGECIPSWQMFHCVVWIVYSFLTDVQLRTVDVPLCGHNRTSTVLSSTSVKNEYPFHTTQWNICQEGIHSPHHTMEHQQF